VEIGEKLSQRQVILFTGAMENQQLCPQFMLKPLIKT
jgi:hypothetical protein